MVELFMRGWPDPKGEIYCLACKFVVDFANLNSLYPVSLYGILRPKTIPVYRATRPYTYRNRPTLDFFNENTVLFSLKSL